MRKRLWDTMLDAARMRRYYLAIYKRNRVRHLGLSVVALTGSIAAGTSLLAPDYNLFQYAVNELVGAALFFLVAVATVLMVVYDFSRQAQVALSAALQLEEVETSLDHLWYQDHFDVKELDFHKDRIVSITRDDLVYDDALNRQCNEEALKVVKDFYGPEPNKNGAPSALSTRT